jgi:hypothetical protein
MKLSWSTTGSKPNYVVSEGNGNRLVAGGFSTGATGLEPATSGVTDRYELNRHSRLRPGITG